MSKHIGKVLTSERNELSPQANVDASVGGVEVSVSHNPPELSADAEVVTFQPDDVRTFATLLVRAADVVERMRASSRPQDYLANRLKSAEEALLSVGKLRIECRPCRGQGCAECEQTGFYLAEETEKHFAAFREEPKGGT